MCPIGASCEETVGTAVPSAAGVSACTGGSEKSNAEVAVGVMDAGENAELGVEAESVANRSMVGAGAGAVRRVPNHKALTSNKKPQNAISPTAMIRLRVLFDILLFYYSGITIISGAGTLG